MKVERVHTTVEPSINGHHRDQKVSPYGSLKNVVLVCGLDNDQVSAKLREMSASGGSTVIGKNIIAELPRVHFCLKTCRSCRRNPPSTQMLGSVSGANQQAQAPFPKFRLNLAKTPLQ